MRRRVAIIIIIIIIEHPFTASLFPASFNFMPFSRFPGFLSPNVNSLLQLDVGKKKILPYSLSFFIYLSLSLSFIFFLNILFLESIKRKIRVKLTKKNGFVDGKGQTKGRLRMGEKEEQGEVKESVG